MAVGFTAVDRVRSVIRGALNVEVPRDDTDLIYSGLLDSLALVTIIVEIESEFGVELPLEDFDLDRFRSVDLIAEFLTERYPEAT
jgi:D-alanine--poly(phosphoribitol) ligase subunit 2